MKNKTLPLTAVLLIVVFSNSSCVTARLEKYEPGELISKTEPKDTPLDAKYSIVLNSESGRVVASISQLKRTHSDWIEVHKREAIYQKSCRVWTSPAKNCEVDTAGVIIAHVLVYGFIMDMILPFFPYDGPVTTTEIDGVIEHPSSSVSEQTEPVKEGTALLLIDEKSYAAEIHDGTAAWDVSKIDSGAFSTAKIRYADIEENGSSNLREAIDNVVMKNGRAVAQNETGLNSPKMKTKTDATWCSYTVKYTGLAASTPDVSENCDCISATELHDNINSLNFLREKAFQEKGTDGKVVRVRIKYRGTDNNDPWIEYYSRGQSTCESARRREKKREDAQESKDDKAYKEEQKGFE